VPSDYSARAYDHGGLKPRFLQHHRGAGHSSPMYVYRWETMQELIERFKDWDGDPYEALSIEYVDPLTGGPVFKTMTFFVQVLRPGEKTLPVRQTASLLVAPFEGRGHSIIDGKRFDWQAFDNLAVPGGSWFEHVNGDNRQPAILFVASDEPALKCFHLFKKWGRDAAGGIVKIA
jgi:gentisate 1,2-dioxygenase